MIYRYFFKYLFDTIISIIAIIVLSPLLIVIFILLLFSNKRNVFFIQQRPGKKGKLFNLYKFKTMTDEKDEKGKPLPDDQRLTKIGQFIRSISFDEIPQLINIIKGDMSIVGPRPLMPKYLPLYSKEQMRRHDVKPGITGWAQVNGRNDISWTKKFELDVWYVENLSFILDLKIIILTIMKVIKREGISKSGYATTVAFDGSN